MRIQFSAIKFGDLTKTYKNGNNTVKEHYYSPGHIAMRQESDSFGREIDTKWFDEKGFMTDHMQKEYFETETEKGCIETFKNAYQDYVKKNYTKFENGLKYVIEEFKSKTSKSYKHEFIYDLSGRLVDLITDGHKMRK